ncbi:MAG: DEAD/DEAH box helicase, partial [Candidatus Thorarchaeota archaeon]
VLPIIRKLLVSVQDSFVHPGVRALLLYPTKALARDQYEKIRLMCEASSLTVGVFDGDVTQAQREKIYSRPPDLLLTNPDVLHYHLGWDRSRLVELLRTVKYVVLDEIHLYSGSMGANVYYILKRLKMESDSFQKIGASATIANPQEFAEMLFDSKVELIYSKTAKRGPIHFMMYYPGNRSKYSMIVDLVRMLYQSEFKTLVFGNTHTEAEVLNLLINDQGMESMVHRAGLPKKYRNKVENQFKAGELSVLVSTPTLELGIDIGDLDSVVSMIVSITRLTQRIGRAGRKGQESVAILALRENDPISSFYRHKPDKYFTDVDSAYMEPTNEVVGYYQLIAAAMSGKMKLSMFPQQRKIIKTLEDEGLLSVRDDGRVRVADYERARKAWRSYSIRGIGDTVEIKLKNKPLGSRTMPMAAQELHPGAIYLHGGKNYMSVDFRYTPGLGKATVVPFADKGVHTKPLYSTMPRIIEVHEERKLLGLSMIYCTLEMTQTVHGYVKRSTRTGKVISRSDLPTPLVYRYLTRGFAFKAPEPVQAVNDYIGGKLTDMKGPEMSPADLYGGAFHALEHVVIESSNMFTGGSTREIGGVSMGDSGIIFIYDGSPGGNGASKLLFSRFEDALKRTETILAKCDCKTIDGCPLCTYSYQCGNNNRPLFKMGALDSIRKILASAETTVDTKGYLGYQPVV